jgi:hypothetical protein
MRSVCQVPVIPTIVYVIQKHPTIIYVDLKTYHRQTEVNLGVI